jgi:hypothetical protein
MHALLYSKAAVVALQWVLGCSGVYHEVKIPITWCTEVFLYFR